MAQDINTTFTRELLKLTMLDVKQHTTPEQRKAAWTYWTPTGAGNRLYEFHGPDGFVWHGRADNSYHARAQGWSAWLEKHHPTQDA